MIQPYLKLSLKDESEHWRGEPGEIRGLCDSDCIKNRHKREVNRNNHLNNINQDQSQAVLPHIAHDYTNAYHEGCRRI